MEQRIKSLIDSAQSIVIVQADNPDGDSLASALALEQILGDLGKNVTMYCGVETPSYLRHLNGWDRIVHDLPANFDLSVIVDTSAVTLLEQLQKSHEMNWLKTKPCIVLDHHAKADPTIDFAQELYIKEAVATGELIYELSKSFGWPLNKTANDLIAISILSDSLGLVSESTTARSIHIIGELVEAGVSIAALENERRKMMKKSQAILAYKGSLLQRVEYSQDGRIASITIPWEEIEKYSNEYNPSVLVLDEMRMVHDVQIAVAFKTYPDGKITAKLRSNYGFGIAGDIAKQFGGGGHPYAAGFKITDGRPFNQIKSECMRICTELLDTLKTEGTENETTQYTHTVS